MNLPNKLTVLRVIMIPFFLLFFFATKIPLNYLWAFLIFVTASFTDTLDGHIARKRGIVTDFGKLMDPLADKLLVMSAMVCILGSNYEMSLTFMGVSESVVKTVSLIALILVIARDFVVNSIRLVAAGEGKIIAADKWGKLKTITQMIWVSLVLLGLALPASFRASIILPLCIVQDLLLLLLVILTVGSGFNYVWQNKALFADS